MSAPGGPLDQLRQSQQGAVPGTVPGMVARRPVRDAASWGGAITQTPMVGPDVQRNGVGTPRQMVPSVGQAGLVPPAAPYQSSYASEDIGTPGPPNQPLPFGRGAVLPREHRTRWHRRPCNRLASVRRPRPCPSRSLPRWLPGARGRRTRCWHASWCLAAPAGASPGPGSRVRGAPAGTVHGGHGRAERAPIRHHERFGVSESAHWPRDCQAAY